MEQNEYTSAMVEAVRAFFEGKTDKEIMEIHQAMTAQREAARAAEQNKA